MLSYLARDAFYFKAKRQEGFCGTSSGKALKSMRGESGCSFRNFHDGDIKLRHCEYKGASA